MSTETATKFSDGEIGLSFPDLDDEVESWLLRKYKHMAKYFWSGDLPQCNAATVNRNRRIAREIHRLLLKQSSRAERPRSLLRGMWT